MKLGKTRVWAVGLLALVTAVAGACSSKEPEDDAQAVGGAGGEGMKAMDDDEQSLQIVSRFPEADAEQVDAQAPFVVEFNRALEAESVLEALKLRVGGKEVAWRHEVQGARLLVFLDQAPQLPASVSLSLSAKLRGSEGEKFVGATWSYSLPVWQLAIAQADAADSAVFSRAETFSLLATAREGAFKVQEQRLGEMRLIPPPSERNPDAYTVLSSGLLSASTVALFWMESEGVNTAVYSAVWNGDEWAADVEPIVEGAGLHATTAHVRDRLVLATWAGGELNVSMKEGSEDFTPFGETLAIDALVAGEFAVSLDDEDNVVVAVVKGDGAIELHRSTGAAWQRLGTLSREGAGTPANPSLVVQNGQIYLAYQDGDSVSSHAYVSTWDGTKFTTAPALDLELDAQVSFVRLQEGQGSPFVSWLEEYGEQRRVFVAELRPSGGRILSREALGELQGAVQGVSLGRDELGRPHVAVASSEGALAALLNDLEALPPALAERGERGACVIPEDGIGFPQTLAATGCYLDLKARQLVDAALPYNLNSPLWSDGAAKSRYILLPEDETMDFEPTSAWGMPVGTVLIKEFLFERETGNPDSLFPVETRFLVKRCEEGDCAEPWQGYSYRWNAQGTDGELLSNTTSSEEFEWAVMLGDEKSQRTHVYPGRTQCAECHTAAAGRVLGIDSPQLARSQDYGEYVGHQIETFFDLGLFGDSLTASELNSIQRLPSPADVSRSLEQRTRAYFDSNCAHCHHPDGIRPTIDFRYYGAGLIPDPDGAGDLVGNICDWLVPGDADNSEIYIRDEMRNTAAVPAPIQMPPIATKTADTRQLDITRRFILELDETGKCTP